LSTEILQAALERLLAFDYTPPVPVLWPGLNQVPPQTGLWIEASLFPNEPQDDTWDATQCALDRGFFQLLVGYRPGAGEKPASELADALIAWFAKGTAFGDVRVLKRGTRGPSFVDDGNKLFIPVTLHYIGLS